MARWPTDDAANADVEILSGITPTMLTIPTSMPLCASSAFAQRGALFDAYKNFWGNEDKPLVWRATTSEMNPNADQKKIAADMARDPVRYGAEYFSTFRAPRAKASESQRLLPPRQEMVFAQDCWQDSNLQPSDYVAVL
jgi:hypothetical protein